MLEEDISWLQSEWPILFTLWVHSSFFTRANLGPCGGDYHCSPPGWKLWGGCQEVQGEDHAAARLLQETRLSQSAQVGSVASLQREIKSKLCCFLKTMALDWLYSGDVLEKKKNNLMCVCFWCTQIWNRETVRPKGGSSPWGPGAGGWEGAPGQRGKHKVSGGCQRCHINCICLLTPNVAVELRSCQWLNSFGNGNEKWKNARYISYVVNTGHGVTIPTEEKLDAQVND